MFTLNLDGQKFGKLTVLKTHYLKKKNLWFSLCKCECGKEFITSIGNIRRGNVKTCGGKQCSPLIKHGKINSRLYCIWNNAKGRCYNKNNKDYKNYGARGIEFCEEWKSDFNAFYKWAVSNGYDDKLTLDRKDNNEGYNPKNCRWITNIEQQNNKRGNKVFTYNGITLTITQWEKFLGIGRGVISYRMKKMGMNFCTALTTKPMRVCSRSKKL